MPIFKTISLAKESPFTRKMWKWVVVTPFLLVLSEFLAISPIGTDFFLWLEVPIGVAFFMACGTLCVLPIFLVFKRWRRANIARMCLCLVYIVVVGVGYVLGKSIRSYAIQELAIRSAPLVKAIQSYTENEGAPPKMLEDLVPEYISKIPHTGIMAYPHYHYVTGKEAAYFADNPWVLRVPTPSGGFNSDELMFFPLQNYPKSGFGGEFQKVEDWAYLSE